MAAYDPNAPAADSTGAAKTGGSQIAAWYQQYLGRAPESQDVVNGWAGQDPQAAQTGIENSPEAQAYAASQGTARTAVQPRQPSMALDASSATSTPAVTQPAFAPVNYSGGAPPIASAQGTNPALTSLRNLLLSQATQSDNVDPHDPSIEAATDAYGADVTRAGRSFLSQQAEAKGPTANLDASTRSVGEKAGQATADYRANLVNGLATARRAQIAQALTGLGSTLSEDDATRLRQEDQDLARQQFGAGTAQQAFQDQYSTIFG